MSGKIKVSSGMEDLSSDVLDSLAASLISSEEGMSAMIGMFFPVKAKDETISAAFESFNAELPKDQNPKANDGEGCHCGRRPALASKVIDANGNAYITILYDGNQTTGGGDTGTFVGLINAATANDVVDITIATSLYQFVSPTCNIFATLSLLSAIRKCKAKVITRAGCLCSVGDCAVWLSGKDRRMSPMGWLAVRQPAACGGGTLKDAEFRSEDFGAQLKVFTDYIVGKGLLTAEEVTRMYEDQAMIGLSYDELDSRIKALKA